MTPRLANSLAALVAIALLSCRPDASREHTYTEVDTNMIAHPSGETPTDTVALRSFRDELTASGPIRGLFNKYLGQLGAKAILDVLESTYPGCHAQSHDLGAALYAARAGVGEALAECATGCTSGCMHGVVTGAFGNSTQDRVAERMNEFCAQEAMSRLHKPGNCAHGVGHALMFVTDGDVSRSIHGCLGFHNEAMQYYCGTGVFMERFTRDSVGRAPGRATLSPCDAESLFPAACYRYKGAELWHSLGGPDSVRAKCSALGGLQRLGCYHGLGYAAIAVVMDDPERIVTHCSGQRNDRIACIEGVIEKLAEVHEGRARAACAFIEDELHAVCEAAVRSKMYSLDKPTFALYYDAAAIARHRALLPSRATSLPEHVH